MRLLAILSIAVATALLAGCRTSPTAGSSAPTDPVSDVAGPEIDEGDVAGCANEPPASVTAEPALSTQVRPEAADPWRDPFALRRSDLVLGAVLASVVLTLMIIRWGQLSGWGVRPIEIDELHVGMTKGASGSSANRSSTGCAPRDAASMTTSSPSSTVRHAQRRSWNGGASSR